MLTNSCLPALFADLFEEQNDFVHSCHWKPLLMVVVIWNHMMGYLSKSWYLVDIWFRRRKI